MEPPPIGQHKRATYTADGNRAHFNLDVTKRFFRLTPGNERRITLERVDGYGLLNEAVPRKLVLSPVNRNAKIEFDFGDIKNYPTEG